MVRHPRRPRRAARPASHDLDAVDDRCGRFALVLLSAKRTKQILQGSKILISGNKGNKAIVSSLREIADGHVRFMTPDEVLEAKAIEQAEAEERTREAFARLSQPVVESNGSNGDSNGSGNLLCTGVLCGRTSPL